ncbi:tyrosine-protein kinase Etk/Wzc [Dysgonomonas sp. PFB1-18]|uniref:exopolysaccharide transport family protein n=1 Tax=unclassified Dysgonomonas TaxID=2630389 RepID=UPI002474DF01|nr:MULTISPECIES: tyrosine-protein kinase family protein [unclassified Dysgonomonas]MDL2303148.1 polysaccharide biosynthesis tyrosine autokinase [Dysgonomonas sp. OttesenSCG-928-D17]MDH6308164.1 tyrosine-protein kinase Etk/Wzc [Dysgonomonas sp. PF1-14]MDH6338397.1 tyrosine-protein kinase Etk/Wzc [Dysgonomonas sp. PF1-16]MDH6379894.1 tyrosine-protein kinase Etk/Wzc [Dysgonomonas sp. PFB1-18]MDH6397016.1 tyrosine-protein kinase Etk/Wzc [Dysgonomonas sp. PF1-23]
MDIENKNNRVADNDPYFEEVKSKTTISFDFVLWFYRILKYWYLFVISIALCLTYAYIKNKKWVPAFMIQAVMILQDNNSSSVVSGAIPTASLLRNTENQMIVLRSYGLTERTVENLPEKMRVDYFIKTRFKVINLYSDTPVRVQDIEIKSDEAYRYVYEIAYVDKDRCEVSYKPDPDKDDKVTIAAPFDQEIETNFLKLKLVKTKAFRPDLQGEFKPDIQSINFKLLSNNELIGMFNGRVSPSLQNDNSTILNISMAGSNPARDIDYMGVLLDEFQNYNLTLKNEQAERTITFLDNQLQLINDSLDISRLKLEDFQRATGVYDITSQSLKVDLDSANREKDALAVRERSVLALTEAIKSNIMQSEELIDPLTLNVRNMKLSETIKKYNDVLDKAKNLGAKNPLYNKVIDELNDYRKQILQEVQILQVNLQDQKDGLVRKYMVLEAKMDNLPPQERDFIKFQRENRLNEVYQQYLTQRKREAEIQKASNTPDNFVWEEPRQMGGAFNGDVKNKNYMYFFIIGLIIPLCFVILKEEVLNFSIMTKEECEKISGFPVIGTIENISKKLNDGVVLVKNYPKSSFAESFRNMRVRIEYMAQRESKITVLVTSTEPADGKTFIATNIASVYQLMGKKVVIIDLDLRRPSVAKTLQVDATKGVSNYLIGQVTLDEITIAHPDYGFDIIPAGTLPPNPSELIKTEKTKELLAHLKEVYDYVIVDCSPVGLVSDAYILSELADTTLFVVRRAKTNRSFFKSVITQLKQDGVNNIALVFNDVKGREGYYGTSRYYGDKTYYLKKNSYYHDDYFEN